LFDCEQALSNIKTNPALQAIRYPKQLLTCGRRLPRASFSAPNKV
jgi:hypothetical protein